ncbi:hypothetical protein BKA65DRAFT_486063 [Rhexocercosporidium sp. MPI-PUGE-AT-0058]|nr:hypothetical protein BKA65DRAFT_486063 [Rhexocercosporidium sp. MPI-PUGE-AT-0058]
MRSFSNVRLHLSPPRHLLLFTNCKSRCSQLNCLRTIIKLKQITIMPTGTASTMESAQVAKTAPYGKATKSGISKAASLEYMILSPSLAMPDRPPVRIPVETTSNGIRRSSRQHKYSGTYNDEALAGTVVHTSKKLGLDALSEIKPSPAKGVIVLGGTRKALKPAAAVRLLSARLVKPNAAPTVRSSLGKQVQTVACPSLVPLLAQTNSATGMVDQSAAITSLSTPPVGGITSSIAKPILPGVSVPPSPTPHFNPVIRNLFHRIRLIVKCKDEVPGSLVKPAELLPISCTTKTGKTTNTFKTLKKIGILKRTKTQKRRAAEKDVNAVRSVKSVKGVKSVKSVTFDPAAPNSSSTSALHRKSKEMGRPENIGGDGAHKAVDSRELNELRAESTKRAAPAGDNPAEPLTKKRKTNAKLDTADRTAITLYLNATGNNSTSRCVVLTEDQIFINSSVLKHVLQSKANTMSSYDSDDDLCYNPSTSKDPSKSNTRSIFLRPLLTAILQELDEELSNLDDWDKVNRDYINNLINIPSDKLWELAKVWQNWVVTGDLQLGRCPFQRERMLKFARVMEMPVEFFRTVKKHEVDENLSLTKRDTRCGRRVFILSSGLTRRRKRERSTGPMLVATTGIITRRAVVDGLWHSRAGHVNHPPIEEVWPNSSHFSTVLRVIADFLRLEISFLIGIITSMSGSSCVSFLPSFLSGQMGLVWGGTYQVLGPSFEGLCIQHSDADPGGRFHGKHNMVMVDLYPN